ncbi:hypothetical protein ACHAW6_000890 [Cyclotella cf. meneghiniana]
MSQQSMYTSIWGTTDAINNTPTLSFNSHQAEFPSHVKQEEISYGFKAQDTAEFDEICLAIDGILVWTVQTTRAECEQLQIGEQQFHCWWRDKFGMVLMAGCDQMRLFCWADIFHPGKVYDYLSFAASGLGVNLERNNNVQLNSSGLPDQLLGSGHHFQDLPHQRRPVFPDKEATIPMDEIH